MKKAKTLLIVISFITLSLFTLSPFASSRPDGLERFFRRHGFPEMYSSAIVTLLPGYMIPGIRSRKVSTVVAGLAGGAAVCAAACALEFLLKKKNSKED